jgi:hypothetical protein
VNSFFDLVNKTLGAHRPDSDDRCSCGQPNDDFPWSEHVTQEIIDTLTEHLGLAHELTQAADNPNVILTRYTTEWRED